MLNLLPIDPSALGDYSLFRELTTNIVAKLTRETPELTVDYRYLAAHPLPHGLPPATDANDPAVALGQQILDGFLAADMRVIGVPMQNVSISSQLKSRLDSVLVAVINFHYTANGPEDLAEG